MAIENGMVQELADLQKQSVTAETEADAASTNIDVIIDLKKQELTELETVRSEIRYPYEVDIAETKNRIGAMQDCIIVVWDGEKKTLNFGDKTLKFRTTKSLEIRDDAAMLEELCIRMQSYPEVMKYLKGFNLTAVKKYMGVHDLPPDVAELIEKTTVKLEVQTNDRI